MFPAHKEIMVRSIYEISDTITKASKQKAGVFSDAICFITELELAEITESLQS